MSPSSARPHPLSSIGECWVAHDRCAPLSPHHHSHSREHYFPPCLPPSTCSPPLRAHTPLCSTGERWWLTTGALPFPFITAIAHVNNTASVGATSLPACPPPHAPLPCAPPLLCTQSGNPGWLKSRDRCAPLSPHRPCSCTQVCMTQYTLTPQLTCTSLRAPTCVHGTARANPIQELQPRRR
jgi:hypothetical protein